MPQFGAHFFLSREARHRHLREFQFDLPIERSTDRSS
jgi:hypothetical protein